MGYHDTGHAERCHAGGHDPNGHVPHYAPLETMQLVRLLSRAGALERVAAADLQESVGDGRPSWETRMALLLAAAVLSWTPVAGAALWLGGVL